MGAVCKAICKRDAESGDAADSATAVQKAATNGAAATVAEATQSAQKPVTAAPKAAVAAKPKAKGAGKGARKWVPKEAGRSSTSDGVEDDNKISDLLASSGPGWFSFEYFPPKTNEGAANLNKRIQRMKTLNPLFLDFTWGAGGSTSDMTLKLTAEAKNVHGCVANMHLTCTNQKGSMCADALNHCKAQGIRNIVALRGDPPRGQDKWTATEGGFSCALDLVKFIREKHGDYFCISIAGYPEGHPDVIEEIPAGLASLSETEKRRARVVKDSSGKEVVSVCRDDKYAEELAYLKEKVDAGSDFIITQMFLDHKVFFDFVQDCRTAGIMVPVIPGIMMLNTFGGLQRMTELCKTRIPEGLFGKGCSSKYK